MTPGDFDPCQNEKSWINAGCLCGLLPRAVASKQARRLVAINHVHCSETLMHPGPRCLLQYSYLRFGV